ncbi:MAG: hypothetical protein M3O82_01900 [Verrucomicrobiota bacterium]|nr:hypothetical protein [Verrucomicrobiota bacterium]
MFYGFLTLRTAGFIVGLLLLVLHGLALVHADGFRAWLKQLPRSKTVGNILITLDAVWAFVLVATMDLGEFTTYRRLILVVVAVAYFLFIKFVDEFLAARALGILCLLAAEPILEAAFLRPETSRLLLVVLAYVWVVLGMFWVGMPYVLRNQIDWLLKSSARWRWGCYAGLAYGLVLVILPATRFR